MNEYLSILADTVTFAWDELALIGCNMDRLSAGKVDSKTSVNGALTAVSVYFTDKYLHYSVKMGVVNNQDISLKSILIRPLRLVPGFEPKEG